MRHLYIHNEVYKGFKITVSLHEGADPGVLARALAHVRASRHGVLLAETYLGGCDYDPPSDFLYSGYYEDMREEVVADALVKIRMLQISEEA